jgi:hypothetical protein
MRRLAPTDICDIVGCFPLTPALSLGERENRFQFGEMAKRCVRRARIEESNDAKVPLPLPEGEGRGEGERTLRSTRVVSNAEALA